MMGKVSNPEKMKRATEFRSVELSETELLQKYTSCRLYQDRVTAKRISNASITYRQSKT
jgi:hypothetical protein